MRDNSIFQKVRESVDPAAYYRDRLPEMPQKRPRPNGWLEGGLCPFHADKRPGSFHVNFETGAAHCFSCGAKAGGVVDFESLLTDADPLDAAIALAREWGLEA
jgi:DNA primase